MPKQAYTRSPEEVNFTNVWSFLPTTQTKRFNHVKYQHPTQKPIEIIESDDIFEIRKREQFWIDDKKASLNKIRSIDINETRANYKKELYKNKKIFKQNKLIELVKKIIEH
jgi:hypothetical protein